MAPRLLTDARLALLAIVVLWPALLSAQIKAQPYVSGLTSPIGFVQDPSDPTVQYIVQQGGLIRVIKDGVLRMTPFLDLSVGVITTQGSERGLLGLAFPSDYAASRRFYVNFTKIGPSGDPVNPGPEGATVVARFKRSLADPLVADPTTRLDLEWAPGERHIAQPYNNHNGGHLAFGPDGYLYIGMGDGGSGHDPEHRAQNPSTLLGKMLRIDVSVGDGDMKGYAIPPDNPFLDGVPLTALGEIWAFGLRNPWHFSFDSVALGGTGALVIGDVGQNGWEEIDYERANSGGGRNYGWHPFEGFHPHADSLPPAYTPLTDPLYEYPHPTGNSITGGFVYRGSALHPKFRGRYFYADFVSGRVWSLGLKINMMGNATPLDNIDHSVALGGTPSLGLISAWGQDAQGELYVVTYAGAVFKIVSTSPSGLRGVSDFDNDVRADPTVWRAPTNTWFVARSATNYGQFIAVQHGNAVQGDRAVPGDYDGDAITDPAVWTPASGIWSLRTSSSNFISTITIQWGRESEGDRPVPGDYDGDGRTDPAVWRQGSGFWYILKSSANYTNSLALPWGSLDQGDTPVPGDYDGDGKTDPAVWRASTGFWYALLSGTNYQQYLGVPLGSAAMNDRLVAGDYDGDGKTDPAVWRPSTGLWSVLLSSSNYMTLMTVSWGRADLGDVPVPADYDGDRKTDFAVWRQPTGTWYALRSATNYQQFYGIQWGSTDQGDVPIVER